MSTSAKRQPAASWRDRLFAGLLVPLPHHLLSRAVYWLVGRRFSPWKNGLIRWFCRTYRVDLADALAADAASYASFGDFFVREINLARRPLPDNPKLLVSPADGAISQFGRIEGNRLLQAKGRFFTLAELLAEPAAVSDYLDGSFCTLYLAPRDYHRVHMPLSGSLRRLVYVPGRLFSVREATARALPGLYARNERAIFHFVSPSGPFAVIMVGALFVSSIATAWGGLINPHGRRGHRWQQEFGPIANDSPGGDAAQAAIELARGAELGRFHMGSTAIVLLPKPVAWAEDLVLGGSVRVRQALGSPSEPAW